MIKMQKYKLRELSLQLVKEKGNKPFSRRLVLLNE